MINKKILSIVIAASSTGLLTTQAHADLNIYADPNIMSKQVNQSETHSFKQIGTSLEKSNIVSSGQLPLGMALNYLVPEGWDVRVNNDLDLSNEDVSWKGNVTWPYALEHISRNRDLDVVVNWERRYISVDSQLKKVEREKAQLIDFETALAEQAQEQPKASDLLKPETQGYVNESNAELNTNLLTPESNQESESNEQMAENELLTPESVNSPQNLLSDQDRINNIAESSTGNNAMELTPSEEFRLRRSYEDAYILPYDESFESYVASQEIDIHEYMELTFILKAGMTVQENIREWGRVMPADWTIEWDAEKDFLIDKEIKLKSTFIDVFPIVEAFYDNSPYPIEMNMFLKNTTIRVINKDYKINHSGV
jgi:hypothetical protein